MPTRISDEKLEVIAEEFLAKNATGNYDGLSLRIESLLEGVGYTIFPVKGLAEVAEAYIPLKSGFIFVDEDQFICGTPRFRFTLAEEFAHDTIHRPRFDGMSVEQIIKFQDSLSDAEYLKIEREAKYLAGALLMPRKIYRERFAHFFTIHAQRTMNVLHVHRNVLRSLSLDFNVSYHSVGVRAVHLNLLDWEQLDDIASRS